MATSHLRRALVPDAAVAALLWIPTAGAWSGSGSGSGSTTASSYSGEACVAKTTISGPPVARRLVRRLAQVVEPTVVNVGCAKLPSSGGAEQSSLGTSADLAGFGSVSAEAFGGQVVGQ